MKNSTLLWKSIQPFWQLVVIVSGCFLLLTGTPTTAIAQNDTVLPTYEAEYQLDGSASPFIMSFGNYDFDDTVEVYGNSSDPMAKIFFGDSIAYIIATPYGAGLFAYPFQDSTVALYDFTLVPGDTAYFEDNSGNSNQYSPVIVESVSYVTVEGIQRKKIALDNSDVWIQGVGSLIHPLWPIMYHFEVYCSLCYMKGMNRDFTSIAYYVSDCSGSGSIGLEENKPISGKVVKTVDQLGRETSDGSNQVLFSIMDDGTVKRMLKFE